MSLMGRLVNNLTAWGDMIGFRLSIGFVAACVSVVLTAFSAFRTHLARYLAATLVAFTIAPTAHRAVPRFT